MEGHGRFKEVHHFGIVELVVYSLNLLLVLHESVNDRFITFLKFWIHVGHVDLAQHIGSDIVANVFIGNSNTVFFDQLILNKLPFH